MIDHKKSVHFKKRMNSIQLPSIVSHKDVRNLLFPEIVDTNRLAHKYRKAEKVKIENHQMTPKVPHEKASPFKAHRSGSNRKEQESEKYRSQPQSRIDILSENKSVFDKES